MQSKPQISYDIAKITTLAWRNDKVIHHVEASIFPNWIGEDQVRIVDKLTKDLLVLCTQPHLAGGKIGTAYPIWHRA